MRVKLQTLEPTPTVTPYVPIADAAKSLGLSPDSIRRAIRNGEGAKFGGDRIGGRYIIRRIPFERYLRGEDAASEVA